MSTRSESPDRSPSPSKRKRGNSSEETNPTSVSSEASSTISKPERKVEKLALSDIPEQEPHPSMTIRPVAARSNPNHRWAWRQPADAPPSPLLTFAIETDHPLLPLWPRFERDLIDLLNASPVSWSALEVFHRRRTIQPSNEDDTTVMVTAIKQGEPAWSDLQREIREYLNNQGQSALQVEMIDGVISRCPSEKITDCEYIVKPNGGVGVGVTGLEWSSGTFGGYLLLTQKGHASLNCAITCHHVMRPTRKHTKTPSGPAPLYDPILDNKGHYHKGVAVDSENNDTVLVDQPSLGDHTAALERSQVNIDKYHEWIKETEEELDTGFSSPKLMLKLSRLQEAFNTMRERYQMAQSFNRVFGHILATSGYICAPTGCALDWGLIVVRPSRLGQNIVPDFSRKPEFIVVKPGDAISEFGVMKLGDDLMLFGRVSGVKVGEFSAIISDIKWREQPTSTKEYAICNNNGERFSEDGDSGAFVLNRDGQLVGILVGGNTTGQAYVTPIQAVIDDIRAQTGFNVCLP